IEKSRDERHKPGKCTEHSSCLFFQYSFASGRQSLFFPAVGMYFFEDNSVMQPVGAALPEFQIIGDKPESSPKGRPGYRFFIEPKDHVFFPAFKKCPAWDGLALWRSPGANLAALWPG